LLENDQTKMKLLENKSKMLKWLLLVILVVSIFSLSIVCLLSFLNYNNVWQTTICATESGEPGVSMDNPFYCYATDITRPQTQMHSQDTSYEAVRGKSLNVAISSCIPSKFWYLGRHGGSYPADTILQRMLDISSTSFLADVIRNVDEGRTTLCKQDIELIRNWVRDPNITLEWQRTPTVAGWTAMKNIARRYQERFPQLLSNVYNRNQISFRHTQHSDATGSIRGFADGLYGDGRFSSVEFKSVPVPDDWFLLPETCTDYVDATRIRPHRAAFEKGPEIEKMLQRINTRIGFRGSQQLSLEQVFTLADWCKFEIASTFDISQSPIGELSAWCVPFTIPDHAILEYLQDLGNSYYEGYGSPNRNLMENLPCGVIQDMLLFINSTDSVETSRVFVGGVALIGMVLVSLDAYRDNQPLHEHNFAQQFLRNWRSSLISSYGVNIVAVRYDCDDQDNDIAFFLSERPILLPGCDMVTGLCKQSFLMRKLQKYVNANCETLFCTTD